MVLSGSLLGGSISRVVLVVLVMVVRGSGLLEFIQNMGGSELVAVTVVCFSRSVSESLSSILLLVVLIEFLAGVVAWVVVEVDFDG